MKDKKRVMRVLSTTCEPSDDNSGYTWHKYQSVYAFVNTGKVQAEYGDGSVYTLTPMSEPLCIPVLTKYRFVPIETSEIMLVYRGYDIEGDVYH